VFGAKSVTSSIVRGNDGAQLSNVSSVTFCNVEGGAPGAGNIDLDALFVDAAAGDFHLQPLSPCIDAGDPATADPDGSVADMGAFPFQRLYTRTNTSLADWLDPGWPEVSALVGGKQVLTLNAAPHAGDVHFLVGSVSGTSPPTAVGGITLPLALDAYLAFTALHPNTPPLSSSLGLLGPTGLAQTVFALPPGSPAFLAGLTAHHAFVVLDLQTGGVPLVSNPEPVRIVP
jgi:hypothetical protein